eukprot:GHVH01017287.1.p3 GENE.GHVH01017287.1~~GHVH01017287.1.p3  ORF type:complete len:155 (+),score=36.44 GHVH01017287.1:43-507(+)
MHASEGEKNACGTTTDRSDDDRLPINEGDVLANATEGDNVENGDNKEDNKVANGDNKDKEGDMIAEEAKETSNNHNCGILPVDRKRQIMESIRLKRKRIVDEKEEALRKRLKADEPVESEVEKGAAVQEYIDTMEMMAESGLMSEKGKGAGMVK